jgi:hypothetical protein
MIEFAITNQANAPVRYRLDDENFRLPPRYTRTHQVCRPSRLSWQWPQQQADAAVQPSNGDHFTIVQGANDNFEVRASSR